MIMKWRDGGGKGPGLLCFIEDIDYNGISKWIKKEKSSNKYGCIEWEKDLAFY